jgi:hypothetical protein
MSVGGGAALIPNAHALVCFTRIVAAKTPLARGDLATAQGGLSSGDPFARHYSRRQLRFRIPHCD